MKCISIKQPWASLIIFHGKDIENRTWGTSYTGPLLIHSSKNYDHAGDMYLHSMPIFSDIPAFLPSDLPMGAIIGRVLLIGCYHRTFLHGVEPSRWFFGPWGWLLKEPQAFKEPIPYKGRLGIFEVPEAAWR